MTGKVGVILHQTCIVTQSLVGRVDLVLVMCELGLLGTVRQLHQLGLLPEHDQGLPLLINEVTI